MYLKRVHTLYEAFAYTQRGHRGIQKSKPHTQRGKWGAKKQKKHFIYLYTYIKYYQANASTVQGSSLQAKPKLNQ